MNSKDIIDLLTLKRWRQGPVSAVVSYKFRDRLGFGHYHKLKLTGADIADYAHEMGLHFRKDIESVARMLAAINGAVYAKNAVVNHNRLLTFSFRERADAEKFKSDLTRRYPDVRVRL